MLTVSEWILTAWLSISLEIVEKVSLLLEFPDGSEDFLMDDIDNESESGDSGNDSSVISDGE
jgi:hypothetical protein